MLRDQVANHKLNVLPHRDEAPNKQILLYFLRVGFTSYEHRNTVLSLEVLVQQHNHGAVVRHVIASCAVSLAYWIKARIRA